MNARVLFVQFFYQIRERTTILQVPRFDLGLDCLLPKTNGSSTLNAGFSSVCTFNFTHFRNVQVAEHFSVPYVTRAATVYEKFYVLTRRKYLTSMKRDLVFQVLDYSFRFV